MGVSYFNGVTGELWPLDRKLVDHSRGRGREGGEVKLVNIMSTTALDISFMEGVRGTLRTDVVTIPHKNNVLLHYMYVHDAQCKSHYVYCRALLFLSSSFSLFLTLVFFFFLKWLFNFLTFCQLSVSRFLKLFYCVLLWFV